MRLLVIDPGFGAAGDMMCGALLAAGADRDTVLSAMRSTAPELSVSQVVRCGIPAWYVRTHAGPAHRTLAEVLEIVRAADAPEAAIDLAERVFSRIAAAEEKVHRTHHVHFHEVGADDAIADVLGTCTALVTLGVDAVHILPLSVGFGTTVCAHGTMPVPAPATAEILRNSDLQVSVGEFAGELCTPTGAALLAEFSASFGTSEHTGKIVSTGCGAGTRDPADHPNVLRAIVIDAATRFFAPAVDVLETNVDDVSGELLSDTISTLMDAGARDACLVPVVMKKGRPGYIVRVIAMPEDSERLARLLARETGSLGVRCMPMVHRFVADRRISSETVVVNGNTFTVDVKAAFMDGKPYLRKAEFDQVRDAANAAGVSVRDMKRVVEEEAWKKE
ncbi:nickel pincer cofactor biosynthesis protein LarC [Methanocorpusculum sp. MG]|uniref:Putative nickel insertion protein n=1 Tax=Methanocorpusculum petauri TaxID=3002863 RepID=A0ABT4II43_9EURY|nr:nickel pincer cofactor biosynthesis protein LarC [Methanocorpusculum petauri]MCZ0860763.1 nickel pincer cofactor biosynthesis protein LarC [Methanocorpusculum petauri]MDE2442812.1 nickel pincer cofactor biosynthesis protein LarC [Methanocorpusculum sp.]